MNGQVKFKVNAHVDAKVKVQAKVLTMVMLKLKIRPNLRSRIGLQFKSQLQANMVKLQCKVGLSFFYNVMVEVKFNAQGYLKF